MTFKKTFLFLLVSLCTTAVWSKDYVNIGHGWKFMAGSVDNGQGTTIDDKSWPVVNIPHSWNALDGQDGGGDYRRGDGWYRKLVAIPASAKGKRVYLDIAAANMTAEVYVNGTPAGRHVGGYGRFTLDITGLVKAGRKALIAIRVNNEDVIAPPRQADFTFSGGIHRDIRLIVANNLHIAPTAHVEANSYLAGRPADIASPGVKVRQYEVSTSSAKVDVSTQVRNSGGSAASATAHVAILDRNGRLVTEGTKTIDLGAHSDATVTQTLTVSSPHLWNGTIDPYLYQVVVTLSQGRQETDRSVQPLGLRFYSVSKTEGFMLNGKSYPLRGMAFHDEHLDKGRAISDADRLRDLEIIRRSGANYVRMSHYQHGDYEYAYCDSVGIICWTEIPCIDFMCPADSQATFQHNAATQLYELIRQEYNHPSVCFWGLCNEIRRENPGADVPTVVRALNDLAHSEDDTRLTTLAHDKADVSQIRQYGEWQIPDVVAVNKYVGWYEGDRNDIAAGFERRLTAANNATPKPLGMSEYGAGGSPYVHHDSDTEGGVTGSSDHPEEFQAYSHEQVWSVIRECPWFWGTTCWVAFDFASDGRKEGDEPGINDKGIVTHDRAVKKDAYFMYQAALAPFGVVHIKSRRYVSRTSPVTVKAYSNCTGLKVRVNGGEWHDMASTNPAVRLYARQGVQLSPGANIVEVSGRYGNDTITDKAVWYVGEAHNTVKAEHGAKGVTLTYDAPVEGTYTLRVWHAAGQQRKAVAQNVFLQKGANTITLNPSANAGRDIDSAEVYFYHTGKPTLEDNIIPTLVPIPDNPNRPVKQQ